MVWGSMWCGENLEHSDLSKASLVDGFKFPSAIALTIVGGISLIAFGLGQGKKINTYSTIVQIKIDHISCKKYKC